MNVYYLMLPDLFRGAKSTKYKGTKYRGSKYKGTKYKGTKYKGTKYKGTKYTTTIESPIKVSFEKCVINDSLNSLIKVTYKCHFSCVINEALS